MKDGFAKRWATWVVKRPFVSMALSLLMALSLGYGGQFITMSSDYRYFFGKDNPQRVAFENLQDTYSKDDSALFTITPKDGNVFKEDTLRGVIFLTEKSWKLPFVTRVDSISNFQYTKSIEDDLIVKDLVKTEELDSILTAEEFAEIKRVAMSEPLLYKRLISQDGTVTGVNANMTFPGKSPFEIPNAAAKVRELAKEFKEKFPNHDLHISGMVMMNNAFNEAGMKDMMTLTPIMYAVIILIMFIMVRTVAGVIATVIVMFLSIMSGMGFAGLVGIPLTPPSSIAPTIIMTLAIADSIHILKSILASLAEGLPKKEAIIEGLRVNYRPVFLTSFTTAIGFLSLNFSDTPPFHDLGNITAVGVTAAFILSTVFLPAMISLLPMSAKLRTERKGAIANKYGAWVGKNVGALILGTIFVVVFLGAQIPKIRLNDQFVNYFDKTMQFRIDADYTMDNLTGIYTLNFDLKSGESQGITDPAYLQKVEDFANYLRSIPKVEHVNTITDTFKRLNKNMHGDDESYYKLPANRELAAQYLLLYEMSLPYGLDLNNQIDVDKSSTRLIATIGNIETSEVIAIAKLAEKWLVDNAAIEMHTLATSPVMMFAYITNRNVKAMFWGTLFAFGLITIIMIFSIGSVKYGLISLLPNLVPAMMSFGVWSLVVGEAGFAIALVGSVTLGIVVDDTVHFLSKYAQAKQEKGLDAEEALKYAFQNVGAALVATSIILVVGFTVLMFSTFKMNIVLGALSALTIGIALLVDFTFLPALLDYVDQKDIKLMDSFKPKNIVSILLVGVLAFGLSTQVKADKEEIKIDVTKSIVSK